MMMNINFLTLKEGKGQISFRDTVLIQKERKFQLVFQTRAFQIEWATLKDGFTATGGIETQDTGSFTRTEASVGYFE